ncbi:MAG: PorV/PorQ family protein [Ignavibacteria bacterium]|nr:PorV/PorQ family protein [Ignavibacteria bacterium]
MRNPIVRFVFLALVLCVSASPLGAQGRTGIGKYAGEFMASGLGGRALAMGGAYVAVANDVTGAYWNPASLMRMQYPEIGLMYEQRFGGLLNYNYGGVAWPFGTRNTLALTVTRSAVDDMDNTTNALMDLNGNGVIDDGERLDKSKITKFNTADWAMYMTYAFRGSDRLNLGVNLKLIMRTLADESAYGVGFDIGAQYAVTPQFFVGANLQDVTTTLIAWSTGTNDLVSPTAKIGAAYAFEVPGGTLMPAVDFDLMGENRQFASTAHVGPVSINPRAGLEYQFRNLFSIRGGFSDTQNFTVGAGVHLPKLFLDYAYGQSPLSSEMKDASHRISLRISLEEKKFFRSTK